MIPQPTSPAHVLAVFVQQALTLLDGNPLCDLIMDAGRSVATSRSRFFDRLGAPIALNAAVCSVFSVKVATGDRGFTSATTIVGARYPAPFAGRRP
jgi:hypothetical protein